ncbi:gp22 [Mycobacterium phage Omega]|uniref:Uncharacterized protein n=1 Tax=Mycobacterium phage Omega TaxID=2907835 RepID=Q854P2_BPMOM|nr:gp22 [Mycobacterium phage Omega]AAN12666.1 hypothetical protein PBI_OMEGA_22 [Mycobacterium phage Omega]
MTAATEITLNDAIREVIADNPDVTDVWELAEKVADATPDHLIRDFFIKSLPPQIRIFIGNERNAALNDVRRAGGGAVRSGKANKSNRTKAYAEENPWAKFLEKQIGTDRGYVIIKELNHDDVKFLIESRRMAAEAANADADYWARVLAKMELENVETVGELSGPVE